MTNVSYRMSGSGKFEFVHHSTASLIQVIKLKDEKNEFSSEYDMYFTYSEFEEFIEFISDFKEILK